MPDGRNATIPETLMAAVERTAQAQRRSVEEVLADAVQSYINCHGNGQGLEESFAFGERHARSLGLTPEGVAPAIATARLKRRGF